MKRQQVACMLARLETALQGPDIPHSVCYMSDGQKREFEGLSVLPPFLNGEIEAVICDDADTAHLLQALDADIKIEIAPTKGA